MNYFSKEEIIEKIKEYYNETGNILMLKDSKINNQCVINIFGEWLLTENKV